MKICNLLVEDAIHLAVETGRGLVDATAAGFEASMDEVIAGADRSALTSLAADESLPVVEEPVYANVVNRPDKLVCIGLNYQDHASGVDMPVSEYPVVFSKFADSLAAHGERIELPEWERSYDYEAELVIVVGKEVFGVSEAEAAGCIFGYTCGNDLSCRAPQLRSSQWLIGKAMPGFGPCGPCIVTADAFDPSQSHYIRSYVNGELRQDGNTADMIHSCAKLVSYVSRYIRLRPGDLIFTGTPGGVALEGQFANRWMESGDKVDVEIEGIGMLSNSMC